MTTPVDSELSQSEPPFRPYANGSATMGNSGRTGEFAGGVYQNGTRAGVAAPDPGLNFNSQQFNAMVPRGYRPSSVLMPIGSNPGGNGMSQGDRDRRFINGQYMGSVNGTSVGSFEPSAILRASGDI